MEDEAAAKKAKKKVKAAETTEEADKDNKGINQVWNEE